MMGELDHLITSQAVRPSRASEAFTEVPGAHDVLQYEAARLRWTSITPR
jgi:hypothetical protein